MLVFQKICIYYRPIHGLVSIFKICSIMLIFNFFSANGALVKDEMLAIKRSIDIADSKATAGACNGKTVVNKYLYANSKS